MKISELKDKQIAILGMGKEGISTLRFLREQGIPDTRITLLDTNPITDDSLKSADIWEITGEKYLDTLWDFDVIFKSPWVSPFQESLIPYRDKFVSQSQIFFENYPWKVIGITGTKGKSTVSSLLYEILKEAGYDVKLVWNIGNPVLDEIDFAGEVHDFVVYELSSYMLQDFVPRLDIGFLNNIFPCHLDWHFDSFNIYREAKTNILKDAKLRVLHGDLSMYREVVGIKEDKIFFDTQGRYNFDEKSFFIDGKSIYSWDTKLLWEHNRKNILWVIAILDTIIQDKQVLHDVLWKVLPTFHWLPNRIEDIWVYEKIRFINDAIATTPESTIAAIETFWDELQTLFLWGEDSGFDFSALRERILESNIQNIVAFPDTSEKIFPEITLRDYEQAFEIELAGKSIQFIKTRSMNSAVDFAYKTTLPGKTALLSCAAPSFSLWKNYQQKAEEFKKYIENY